MAITAALISGGLAAGGSLGSSLLGLFGNNNQAQRSNEIQQEQLNLDRQNATNQQMVQALVNQRAVAGTQDSMGTSVQYDPQTNTWKTVLGPLPQQAATAATQAGIQQNTTDRARQELINEVAARHAAAAQPAADAAARDVGTFRPMQGNELTGLLTDQATIAARQAYDPLRADVLRSTARTGTAAGPVLAELGRSEAQNLRNSLIDAQVQGMTDVGNINQQRLGNLTSKAGATASLASPNLTTPPIAGDNTSALLAQLTGQRASGVGGQTASGMAGANLAGSIAGQQARNITAGSIPQSDFGLTQAASGLKNLGTAFGPGGQAQGLPDALMKFFQSGPNTATSNPSQFTQDDQGNVFFGQGSN